MKATTKDAYKLLHDGILALAQVEENGMCVDVKRLDRTIARVGKRIKRIEARLKEDEVWRLWRRRFGQNANFGARDQLGTVLYGEMGFKPKGTTRLGKRAKVDKDALAGVDLPFVEKYLLMERLKKTLSTNLKGIQRELVGNRLRPSYSLNLARTFRSACSNPNSQNFPVRDEEISKMVRSCIVPTDKDHVLVEIDYSALEVRIAACYHKDPTMLKYLQDPDKDMHRDAAMDVYMLSREEVTKAVRFYVKNQFVFPEFYGSYFKQCAPNLWGVIRQAHLETTDGVPLKEHLRGKGIRSLGKCDPDEHSKPGTFEHHIQEVERVLWDEQFPVYRDWKKEWFKQYEKTGGFDTLTGFHIEGVLVRNDVINWPVQGSAFHCLLLALIIIVKEMGKKKMRSKIVGQIHDSIIADVHRDELDDYLGLAKRVMTEDVPKKWKWIVVPLAVDAEVGETNWFEKREVTIP